jgi:hypothetical protein
METTDKIIYPNNPKKYKGWLHRNCVRYFENGIRMTQGGLNDRDEAELFRRERAILANEVKNICFDRGDYYEMVLTKGMFAKIDKEDWELLDKNIWHATSLRSDSHYASTTIGKKRHDATSLTMHNLLMEFKSHGEFTVEHINNDNLDNRKCNLRITDCNIYYEHKLVGLGGTANVRGVSYDQQNNRWKSIYFLEGKKYTKSFGIGKYGDKAFGLAVAHREIGKRKKELTVRL